MRPRLSSTRDRALVEATALLQSFGYNGFSFQHIADHLKIKKPSLYDHFASKEELGKELVREYHSSFAKWTKTIEVFSPQEKVGAMFELFFQFSSQSRKVCPMSALIGDYNSLPKSVRLLLKKAFLFQRSWLATVISEGQKAKRFRRDCSSEILSQTVWSMGLGAQMIGRVTEEPEALRRVKRQCLEFLEFSRD